MSKLDEALEEAEEGLYRWPGGSEETGWGICCFCWRADFEKHKENCEGAILIKAAKEELKELRSHVQP